MEGLPSSTILAFSITNILSDDIIVFILCAIVTTVQLLKTVSNDDYMTASVLISILAVASSIKIILLFFRIALAMQSSCFYPILRLSPFSVIYVSSPSVKSKSSCIYNISNVFIILASSNCFNGSMFKRTEPSNKYGSFYNNNIKLIKHYLKNHSNAFPKS